MTDRESDFGKLSIPACWLKNRLPEPDTADGPWRFE